MTLYEAVGLLDTRYLRGLARSIIPVTQSMPEVDDNFAAILEYLTIKDLLIIISKGIMIRVMSAGEFWKIVQNPTERLV